MTCQPCLGEQAPLQSPYRRGPRPNHQSQSQAFWQHLGPAWFFQPFDSGRCSSRLFRIADCQGSPSGTAHADQSNLDPEAFLDGLAMAGWGRGPSRISDHAAVQVSTGASAWVAAMVQEHPSNDAASLLTRGALARRGKVGSGGLSLALW